MLLDKKERRCGTRETGRAEDFSSICPIVKVHISVLIMCFQFSNRDLVVCQVLMAYLETKEIK